MPASTFFFTFPFTRFVSLKIKKKKKDLGVAFLETLHTEFAQKITALPILVFTESDNIPIYE
jgi:hypothetical protein